MSRTRRDIKCRLSCFAFTLSLRSFGSSDASEASGNKKALFFKKPSAFLLHVYLESSAKTSCVLVVGSAFSNTCSIMPSSSMM